MVRDQKYTSSLELYVLPRNSDILFILCSILRKRTVLTDFSGGGPAFGTGQQSTSLSISQSPLKYPHKS